MHLLYYFVFYINSHTEPLTSTSRIAVVEYPQAFSSFYYLHIYDFDQLTVMLKIYGCFRDSISYVI